MRLFSVISIQFSEVSKLTNPSLCHFPGSLLPVRIFSSLRFSESKHVVHAIDSGVFVDEEFCCGQCA